MSSALKNYASGVEKTLDQHRPSHKNPEHDSEIIQIPSGLNEIIATGPRFIISIVLHVNDEMPGR